MLCKSASITFKSCVLPAGSRERSLMIFQNTEESKKEVSVSHGLLFTRNPTLKKKISRGLFAISKVTKISQKGTEQAIKSWASSLLPGSGPQLQNFNSFLSSSSRCRDQTLGNDCAQILTSCKIFCKLTIQLL